MANTQQEFNPKKNLGDKNLIKSVKDLKQHSYNSLRLKARILKWCVLSYSQMSEGLCAFQRLWGRTVSESRKRLTRAFIYNIPTSASVNHFPDSLFPISPYKEPHDSTGPESDSRTILSPTDP